MPEPPDPVFMEGEGVDKDESVAAIIYALVSIALGLVFVLAMIEHLHPEHRLRMYLPLLQFGLAARGLTRLTGTKVKVLGFIALAWACVVWLNGCVPFFEMYRLDEM